MRPLIQEVELASAPETIVESLGLQEGVVLLRSALLDGPARYSFLAARPFLKVRSYGSRILLENSSGTIMRYGNPWHVLDELMARYELLDELDFPFPLGGCFGFWGFELKNFVEPKLRRSVPNDLDLPDCWVGFYGSLLVFDHSLGKAWIIATGLSDSASRSNSVAQADIEWWRSLAYGFSSPATTPLLQSREVTSSLAREEFIARVLKAQDYIRRGHIYQVNLSHRLQARWPGGGWRLFQRLAEISPAPYAAYLNCGDFELCSSSPEMFLRMTGSHITTRPIKGTRPRGSDALRDAQLAYELQTSSKEISELVMITDLLRNDLGRVCEFGSISVPDLVRLERYAQVQHLVSTVEGRLREDVTHFRAFSSCFPGGSISGAPKVRALEIIDELETCSRGPYTGALGYLGFNRESQLSIAIRCAFCFSGRAFFPVGAGIVSESVPESEYDETLAKAAGFLSAVSGSPFSVVARCSRLS